MSKDEKEKKDLFFSKRLLLIAIAVLILVVSVILVLNMINNGSVGNAVNTIVDDIIIGKEGEVRTVSLSEIQEVVKKGHLYIAECVYDGYTAVYEEPDEEAEDEEEEKEVKYYVAYKGKVKAGIDIEKIDVSMDLSTSEIIINLPEVQIETMIDATSLDYIFMDDDYNTETVAQEAYKAAYESLNERASKDEKIVEMATERAKNAEKALVQPWLDSVDPSKTYTVKVLAQGEK